MFVIAHYIGLYSQSFLETGTLRCKNVIAHYNGLYSPEGRGQSDELGRRIGSEELICYCPLYWALFTEKLSELIIQAIGNRTRYCPLYWALFTTVFTTVFLSILSFLLQKASVFTKKVGQPFCM